MYELKNNEVSFKRGSKPPSVRSLQKEAFELYSMLSLYQPTVPKSEVLAKTCLYREILKIDPAQANSLSKTMPLAVSTATRAYGAMGSTLLRHKIFSLDVYVLVEDLAKLDDVPHTLIEEARKRGLTELKLKAKEI